MSSQHGNEMDGGLNENRFSYIEFGWIWSGLEAHIGFAEFGFTQEINGIFHEEYWCS